MDLKYAMGAALVAGAFVAIPVIAADTDWTGRAEQGFTRLDTSHDGNIDKTEAQAWPWLQQNFDRFDGDRDGKLGKDEFAAAVSAERAARRDSRGGAGATSNAGGNATSAYSQFDTLDKNNDGKLDPTEVQS